MKKSKLTSQEMGLQETNGGHPLKGKKGDIRAERA